VLGELLGREDVLAVGLDVFRIAALLVEGIDDARSGDPAGFLAVLGVKQQPARKSSHGRSAAGRLHHRIGPHGHDAHGLLRFLVTRQRH
jgi:hypothetical protein